jgi:hypothetical protein
MAQDGGAALLDAAMARVEVGVGLEPVARPFAASAKAGSTSARSVGWLALTARRSSTFRSVIALAISALVAMASMETSAPP